MPSFKDALKKSVPVPSFAGKRKNAVERKESLKQNPFNTKVTKPKFQVLNRFERGATGNIVQSKTKAHAVRSATLLPQLKEFKRSHTSTFVDRRFGERDKTLSREEVMQERFAREQQRLARKQSRKSKFDLNKFPDEDEAGEVDDDSDFALTHGGRSLSQMDDEELQDYDEYQLDDDENDDETVGIFGKKNARSGNLDKNLVSRGHFGGFEDEGQPKSKQDVMKELIAKSKFHKHERQKVKEENEALTEDLNTMFSEIRGNLQMLNEDDRRRLKESTPAASHQEFFREEDDYESVLKDLTFDPRSRPTNRTLLPEEQARMEQERAEAKEKAMFSRMLPEEERKRTKGVEDVDGNVGLDDSEEDGEENVDLSSAAPVDPELIKIAKNQAALLRAFCKSSTQGESQTHYTELVQYAHKQPRTMIQLARTLRSEIGRLSAAFTERCNRTGRGTFMPALSSHRLLLIVARIFSCSDFHHVVATPAQLLLAYYLRVGRITKLDHVQRALGLAYLATQFQEIGRRCVPEALEVLFTVLAACEANPEELSTKSHYFRRPMSRSIFEAFAGVEEVEEIEFDPSLLLFNDSELSPAALIKFAQDLSLQMFELLEQGEYPALKEALHPFTLLKFCPASLQQLYWSACSGASSLQLQNHKPLALPMLSPDFATDYSLDSHRRDRDETSEVRTAARMKAAVRREYKGAVREIKRDAAFLAEHENKERRSKDAAYKSRMNQIVGSIGNEGSSFKKSRK